MLEANSRQFLQFWFKLGSRAHDAQGRPAVEKSAWLRQPKLIQAASVALGLASASHAVAADVDPAACVADHSDGQVLTRSGKFLEARARFLECSSDACPPPVQRDCRDFAQAVERLIPTLRLIIKDYDGRDLSGNAELDGVPLSSERARQLIEVNPGLHEIRFMTGDHRVTQLRVFAKIGEKNRDLSAHMPAPVGPTRTPAPAELAAAGLGVIGLGLFVGFGLSGHSLQQDLDKCAPYCQDREQADRMRSRYLVADISLGLGLVSLGTAAYLYLTRTRSNQTAHPSTEIRANDTSAFAPIRF